MRTVVLTLEYDGTDFLGWQMQASGRTVQGVLEAALRTLLQEDIRVVAAGRTDTGVHAAGQVVHLKTVSAMACDRLKRGLNALLPFDMAVHAAQEVNGRFHARYSATARQYLYRILRRPSALRRRYAWHVPYALDTAAMRQACDPLVGCHDFTSFCQAASGADGAVCAVGRLRWIETDDELHLDIEANRFLHHMVRTIVGTAVDVGRGRWKPAAMADILAAKDRRMAGVTAPAHGLCLVRISYPAAFGIGEEPCKGAPARAPLPPTPLPLTPVP
jgi:tRNA pseudouridine38-40 synthase